MSLRDVAREPIDVPIGLVNPPVLPARSQMDETKLEELAANIARNGIIQRLILVRDGDRFEVVAGHRRFLAAQRAGLVVVPADVYPTKAAALEAVKHAENRFREEMSAAEEALYFAELLERDYGGDIEALAAGLGEKVAYVDGRLQLVLGDRAVLQALMDKKISIGVAHLLNSIPEEDWRAYYLKFAVRDGATVSTVSGWVAQHKAMYGAREDTPATPTPAAASVYVSTYDPLRCCVCQEIDPRQVPETISVHSSCKIAILDKLLASYRGDSQ